MAEAFIADTLRARLDAVVPFAPEGRITAARGSVLRGRLSGARIGQLCRVLPEGGEPLAAEVVGFDGEDLVLAPMGEVTGLAAKARLLPMETVATVAVGDGLLGRVLDADLLPIDGAGPISGALGRRPVRSAPPPAMSRRAIDRPLATGIRAIDALLTCGAGQRIGLFGPAGCGKSSLLAMLVARSEAEVCVLALVGERGREVREAADTVLGGPAGARTTIVASTSDRPAAERARAAHAATALAEHHREAGRDVLLVVDSITRHARAERDLALAAGEPPARLGFPASVLDRLPRLLERPGRTEAGTITAIYTVLEEGEMADDPVSEEVRSILDGHVVLSPDLAARNHFPAIDVGASRSRLMTAVASPEHLDRAGRVRDLIARRDEAEFLVRVGEHKKGRDPVIDEVLEKAADIDRLLRQRLNETAGLSDALEHLAALAP